MEKIEKAVKISSIIFLIAGATWFMVSSYINYESLLGSRLIYEKKIIESQSQVNRAEALFNQFVGELKGMKNPDVDNLVVNFIKKNNFVGR